MNKLLTVVLPALVFGLQPVTFAAFEADNPVLDMRLCRESLVASGENAILKFWIEVRSTDAIAHKVKLIQNSIKLDDALKQQIKSVTISDWLFSEENYRILQKYTPSEGVWEFNCSHYDGQPWQTLGSEQAGRWSKLVLVTVNIKIGEKSGKIRWYTDTPHYNVRAIKTEGPGSRTIHGREFDEILVDPSLLRIELANFDAESVDGFVDLSWSLEKELDIVRSFYVERALEEKGPYEKVTENPINWTGATRYSYRDEELEMNQKYYYRVVANGASGSSAVLGSVDIVAAPPLSYELDQNYPNPFNPQTQINFKLRADGFVDLSVYNLRGQKVRTLVRQNLKAGAHTTLWNGRNEQGLPLSSGLYLYRIKVNDFTDVRKMQLMK